MGIVYSILQCILILYMLCNVYAYTENYTKDNHDVYLKCRTCGVAVVKCSSLSNVHSQAIITLKDVSGINITAQVLRNKLGQVYEVITADKAACVEVGGSHSENYVYPGYDWRHCRCHACDTHIGWKFEKADDTNNENDLTKFYAILLNQILDVRPVGSEYIYNRMVVTNQSATTDESTTPQNI